MSCHSRCWPTMSLAVALSSRQLKAQWTGTAVGKGCQEATEELGRDVGNGGKESEGSRWRNWRECPVSGNAWKEPAEATGTKVSVECEKVGKPRAFWKASQAGKGAWATTSKGPRGIPGKLGLCALLTALRPRLIPRAALAGPQIKDLNGPPSPTWTLRACGTGHAHESPLTPQDSFQGLCLERGQGRPLHLSTHLYLHKWRRSRLTLSKVLSYWVLAR